ncbi:hypothetical protein QY051_12955 [Enterobacter hormaechei]|uniref:hypothetical protein n=1 Tax=Enterobacter hormaechei TaxID=158836 RepID=UPI002625EB12|nr:hypothetical protein [Enterobacter hormaechei]MDN4569978.1 hypothetical protein [Enterobacter hormaechei]MDN4997603.1 hypothetical protein [Enterobacter hormaechei]
MRTQESLKAIYEARMVRYEKHLNAGMDTTSILLKGHLFVEELLFEILKLHCRDSGPIESIKLGFSHKLNLVHAMFGSHLPGMEFPKTVWAALDKLNKLRNALAHNIDSPKAADVFKSFVSAYSQLVGKEVKVSVTDEIPGIDRKLGLELIGILLYLLGFLGCLHGIAYLNPPLMYGSEIPVTIPNQIERQSK